MWIRKEKLERKVEKNKHVEKDWHQGLKWIKEGFKKGKAINRKVGPFAISIFDFKEIKNKKRWVSETLSHRES